MSTHCTPPPILGLFPWFAPDTLGGIQASGHLAWEALSRRGAAHLFRYGREAAGASVAEGVAAASKGAAVRAALRRRWQAETVLVWHLGLLKLLPLLRLPRARIVLFLHGVEAWRTQDALTRRLLARVSLFLSNSDHTWQRFLVFQPWLAGAAHRTVPLGLGEPTTSTPAPDAVPAALMVGRLASEEDYKGHRQMIAAWSLVRARVPDAELWVAGEGALRAALERAATAPGIHFLGRLSEAEKGARLARCRCFAMPSQGEGFGLVYLEAMRLGRPCLVSTLDAGREVVTPPIAGLAVEPDDSVALAAATARLLTSGAEWEQWSTQARARYAAHFTAAHFQRRLIAALDDARGSAP